MSPTVRLIVNADDFGLTAGVNRAIAELAAAGALGSATLMADGAAFHGAVESAKACPTLAVGCHIVLVDGCACAPPGSVPTLANRDGRLRSSLVAFVADLQRGSIAEAEIEAEAVAQITRLQAAGLTVSHVDTHKHTCSHAWRVRCCMRRRGAASGQSAIRLSRLGRPA